MAKKNAGPPMHTRRPGEVVVVARMPNGSLHAFVPAPWFREAFTDQPAYALVPDVPYLLPSRAVAPGSDGAKMVERGDLRVTDGDEGALPQLIDLSDTTERAMYHSGRLPEPPRRVLIEGLRVRYQEWSLAEAILDLMEKLGWTEEAAAQLLVPEWRAAFARSDGSVTRQSWVRLAEQTIANERAKNAHPAQEGR